LSSSLPSITRIELPLSDFGGAKERRGKAAAGLRRVGPGSVKADARLREEPMLDLGLPAEDLSGLGAGSERVDGSGSGEGGLNLSILRVTQEV